MGPEKCPFCEQEIDAEAVKCFFCGADLNREAIEERLKQLEIQDEKESVSKVRYPSVLLFIVIFVLFFIAVFPHSSGIKLYQSKNGILNNATVSLRAEAVFTGAQFIVLNNDSFDWKLVELQILADNIGSSFTLKVPSIPIGHKYTADATEFADGDGACFNPSAMKILRFRIWCETPTGKKGSYFAELK